MSLASVCIEISSRSSKWEQRVENLSKNLVRAAISGRHSQASCSLWTVEAAGTWYILLLLGSLGRRIFHVCVSFWRPGCSSGLFKSCLQTIWQHHFMLIRVVFPPACLEKGSRKAQLCRATGLWSTKQLRDFSVTEQLKNRLDACMRINPCPVCFVWQQRFLICLLWIWFPIWILQASLKVSWCMVGALNATRSAGLLWQIEVPIH